MLSQCNVCVCVLCFKRAMCVQVSSALCGCLKTNLQLLPQSCCSGTLFSTDSAMKEGNYIKFVHICSFGVLDSFFFFSFLIGGVRS